jgi:hypothetical protein
VLFFQVDLVHVRVGVFGSFGMRVRVLVLEMLMLVAGMRMGVSELVMVVLVGVRCVMTVLMVCHCQLLVVRNPDEIHCALHDDPMSTGLRLLPEAPGV